MPGEHIPTSEEAHTPVQSNVVDFASHKKRRQQLAQAAHSIAEMSINDRYELATILEQALRDD